MSASLVRKLAMGLAEDTSQGAAFRMEAVETQDLLRRARLPGRSLGRF